MTNGEDAHQRMKLEVLRVFDYFKPENVFTSGQIGVAKPDVNAFKKCMEAMHEDITEWYYIGIVIGKALKLSPPFPPPHTGRATFIAPGVPSN